MSLVVYISFDIGLFFVGLNFQDSSRNLRLINMARLVSIIGDANVRRNMTGLNVASREAMKNAQIIDYPGLTPIDQALQEIRSESTICIVAAITEPIVSNGDCGTVFASVDPVLSSLHASISAYCTSHPDLQVLNPPSCRNKTDCSFVH